MDRNDRLSPSHEAYLAKSRGSGTILLILLAILTGYILFVTGGVGGKAIVLSVAVGGTIHFIRKWVNQRQAKV